VNAAECGFVAEAEQAAIFKARSRRSSLEGAASLAGLLDVWSSRLARLADDFSAGRAAVAPTPAACKSCHLHGFCRIPSALEEAVEPHD
jgi:hypothetical protein